MTRSSDRRGRRRVTEAEPNSAVTGRSIEEIAGSEDHVWNSKETAGTGQAWYRRASAGAGAPKGNGAGAKDRAKGAAKELVAAATGTAKTVARSRDAHLSDDRAVAKTGHPGFPTGHADFGGVLRDLPEEKQPAFVKPQLALEAETPPEGAGWLHELKLDGYRMQARKDGASVQMLTRTGLDWTARMRAIADEVKRLPVEKATLDGEVVVLAEDGTTSFAALQAAFQEGERHPLTYFCFDLLHLEGRDTRGLPLVERKRLLTKLLAGADAAVLAVSEHLETGGGRMFHEVCALGAEGIVSKRADGRYLPGSRGGDWLKLKCLHQQEFVVGGYTLPGKGAAGSQAVGALLLGYYKGGKLIYAGRTGTGFTQKTHRMLRSRLETMRLAGKAPRKDRGICRGAGGSAEGSDLGAAGAGGAGALCDLDGGRSGAAGGVSGTARGQAGARGGARGREADAEAERSRAGWG